MKLLAIIGEDVHVSAIRTARQLGKQKPFSASVLNAPLDVDASGWFNRIWDAVEAALNSAYRQGMDATKPLIDKVSVMCAELTTGFAKYAEFVQNAIAERLEAYLQATIDGALERVRPKIVVGGAQLKVIGVTLDQKIKLSGSVKGSLTEICQFVAEGEISVGAQYAAGDPS